MVSPQDYAAQLQWNADWEHELDSSYFPGVENLGSILDRLSPAEQELLAGTTLESHELQDWHRRRMKAVCELQRDLIAFANQRLIVDHLETQWNNFPQYRREEYVLEGIWRAAHIADFEDFREWCPDLTVENLAGRSEVGLFQLIKRLISERPETELTVPVLIPNPMLAKLLPQEKEITSHDFVNQTLVSRCQLITMTLWETMLALVRTLSRLLF
jgi:hypothetical protein